ncbi:MAG: hypothetical protein QOH99_1735 [Frankiaceae bacterium]|nr:hypothetical protein [Frankiaceae bacterium]
MSQQDPLLPVVGAGLAVPVLDGPDRRYVNLDCAATAPALVSVAERVVAALPYYGSVHRGGGYPSLVTSMAYEAARAQIGDFVGARDDDVVVVTRHTTDALNLLAHAVAAMDGHVVLLDIEHHANLLPWRTGRHTCVPAAATWAQTRDRLAETLAARPTALLTIAGASNVTGEVIPLDDVVALARRFGARLAVDAAQLAPHRRIDMSAQGIDYVAFSGHKLYAPYGAGALVGRRDWLDAADPYLYGGGTVESVGDDDAVFAPAPQRHEGGTPNVLGAIALGAACDAVSELAEGAIARHDAALLARLADGLAPLGDRVRVHSIFTDLPDRVGIACLTIPAADPALIAAILSAEHAVGVRSGSFCAHPLVRRLVGPGGGLRVSVGLGSSTCDIDALLAGLVRALTSQPHRYHRVRGQWAPVADTRRAPGLGPLEPGAGASPCAAVV